jgi:antibiotic biosynthesis monooxygenase (ABM) superfamily enzyme
MIRHVVLWELHDPADAARFADTLGECRALADEVAGWRGFEIGVRGQGLASTADVCLVATFDDAEALRSYEAHPLHRAVSARLAPLRRARHVLDFAVG